MGHVLVVLSEAQYLPASGEGLELRRCFEMPSTCYLWKVRTLESTRSKSGLHVADLFLRTDSEASLLLLVGELSIDTNEFSRIGSETVEVWQSPGELRRCFSMHILQDVVADMKKQEANWSFATAARALLSSTSDLRRSKSGRSLRCIQDCWEMNPICTSVVVAFWQRYLVKLAQEASYLDVLEHVEDAAGLIMKWMPLKSDAVLPGELTKVMGDCGWLRKTQAPILLTL